MTPTELTPLQKLKETPMNEEKPQEHMGETIHILDIYHELLFRYITEEDEERRKEIKGKVSGVL